MARLLAAVVLGGGLAAQEPAPQYTFGTTVVSTTGLERKISVAG